MNIRGGLKLIGRPAEIPDCSRDELPEFFKEAGCKVGAEIGVYKGVFTAKLCAAGLHIYAIDPWEAYEDYDVKYLSHGPTQERQDFLYAHTQRYLKEYANCTILRMRSMDAVKEFKDDSLDFVYIDGHHGFKYIAEDLWEWSKKVRSGGFVSGHDYTIFKRNPLDPYTCHVKYAVNGFVQSMDIPNFWIMGRDRGEYSSYLWIKP